MSVTLNSVSAVLSLIAFVFFLIGCIGYTSNEDTVKDVAWIYYEQDSDNEVWFALLKLAFTVDLGPFFGTVTDTVKYDDQACAFDFCDRCYQDGQSAFGLLVLALAATLVSGVISSAIVGFYFFTLQLANVIIAGVALVASVIGIGLFMNGCMNKIRDELDDDKNLEWGPGAIISVVGMLLMFVVMVLQIAAVIVGGTNNATRIPTSQV